MGDQALKVERHDSRLVEYATKVEVIESEIHDLPERLHVSLGSVCFRQKHDICTSTGWTNRVVNFEFRRNAEKYDTKLCDWIFLMATTTRTTTTSADLFLPQHHIHFTSISLL
jgi:hypothetical protein